VVASRIVGLALIAMVTTAAAAQTIEAWLRQLDPEERARQACMSRGLGEVVRDVRLRKADRMKSSIFGRAQRDGTHLVAKGGAVRVNGHWYALSFECHLTPDFMKANDFTFTLGGEIPKPRWDDLGLW
jgi:hypothetical protein